jgi:hypothetical protein
MAARIADWVRVNGDRAERKAAQDREFVIGRDDRTALPVSIQFDRVPGTDLAPSAGES